MSLEPQSGRAPEVTVHELGRGEVGLSNFWQNGPAVLIFLRHFG